MVRKSDLAKDIVELLEKDHAATLQKTGRLQDVLTNLRYEGKLSFGKNVMEARELLKFFNREMVDHLTLEEQVLFPFLQTHIPKLEPAIHFFQAEHEDFKKNLVGFKLLLREILKEKDDIPRGKTIEKIRETGTYLVYLLRNHIQAESESVYKVLVRELRADEKKDLERQIEKCHRRNQGDGRKRIR